MPSQHKHPPVSLRLPGADRLWLLEYAASTGQPVNRVLAALVAGLRERAEQPEVGGEVMERMAADGEPGECPDQVIPS